MSSTSLMKDYEAPEWAKQSLPTELIATKKVQLAVTPTPINDWAMPGVLDNFKLLIKRDDMTGSSLTGNKIRKLEFLLADALQKGAKHVITWGPLQSNQARTTAVACAELGLQCHTFVRTTNSIILSKNEADIADEGNLVLAKLCGTKLYLMEKGDNFPDHLNKVRAAMERLVKQIKSDHGEEAYVIPFDKCNPLGDWGYMDCFREITDQGVEFSDIVLAGGTGATVAGLGIANYLCGSPYKIHCIFVSTGFEVFKENINDSLKAYKIPKQADDVVTLYDDYQEPGYDKNTPEQCEFIADVAHKTGILLDNCYTGKAAHALRDLMQNRPEVFKGRRILFLHTGGIHSLHCEGVRKAMLASCKGQITIL